MNRIYEHRDELKPERRLTIESGDQHIRILCDQPGIAAVSHILTLSEARELVAALVEVVE